MITIIIMIMIITNSISSTSSYSFYSSSSKKDNSYLSTSPSPSSMMMLRVNHTSHHDDDDDNDHISYIPIRIEILLTTSTSNRTGDSKTSHTATDRTNDYLKVYIVKNIPQHYCTYHPLLSKNMSSTYQLKQYPTIDHDDNNFLQNISSIALIGPSLLSKESLYDTKYQHIALWFIHNFYKSQDILAVQQIEEADIIFVPVTFDRRPEDLLLMNHFFNNALKLFPLLQKKPHVIALHLPLSRYLYG